eukprot:1476511-Prymnesium_polylepis.2
MGSSTERGCRDNVERTVRTVRQGPGLTGRRRACTYVCCGVAESGGGVVASRILRGGCHFRSLRVALEGGSLFSALGIPKGGHFRSFRLRSFRAKIVAARRFRHAAFAVRRLLRAIRTFR